MTCSNPGTASFPPPDWTAFERHLKKMPQQGQCFDTPTLPVHDPNIYRQPHSSNVISREGGKKWKFAGHQEYHITGQMPSLSSQPPSE